MASLTNVGGDVLVGDKDFSDFSISGNFSASQVNVTSITENGNYGIRFSGALVAGGDSMDLILGYQVSVTNSPNLISAANLMFNGVVVGGAGLAEVVEQVYTNNNMFYGQMDVFATATTNQLSTSLPITPPQPFLNINKDVLVTAELPAFSSISTIDQTFTQVPEPSTLVLAAAGIAGIGRCCADAAADIRSQATGLKGFHVRLDPEDAFQNCLARGDAYPCVRTAGLPIIYEKNALGSGRLASTQSY